MTNLFVRRLSADVPTGNNLFMNEITLLLTGWGGLALFAVVLADQGGLPVPAPPWILVAGALAASGKMNPALAVGMTALATVLADFLWFSLGRRSSAPVLRLISRWSLSRDAFIVRAKVAVARNGLWALTAAKFLPGTVMPALAGAAGMTIGRFLLFDGLGSLFYGTSYVTAGFLFHNQVQKVMVWLDRLGHGLVGLVLVLAIGYVAYKFILRRRAMITRGRQSNPPEQNTGLADNGADAANLATDGPQLLEVAPAALASASSTPPMPVSTTQLL
jgi:membrane protein DedA with SNARE-associated domain